MSFKRLTLFLLFAISVFWGGDVSAQSRNRLYMQYIDTYKDLAIRHQKKYKIPASITLAQGLLESGAGRGTLARKSNNHFGIKCHNNGQELGFITMMMPKESAFVNISILKTLTRIILYS